MESIMNKTFASILMLLAAPSAFATIQSQINALPPAGGEVKLGCGTFNEPAIQLRDDVALIGSGACTVVPRITVANNTSRHYRIRIENLLVDGAIDGSQYIGIDLRNVSLARVRNVQIQNVQTGVLLYQIAYYNVLEDLIVIATVDCFEIVDGANENILRGGKCQSPDVTRVGTGLWIRDANSVKVFGTSFENLDTGIKLDTGAYATSIYAPRLENMNKCVWLKLGSDRNAIFNTLSTNATTQYAIDSGLPTSAYQIYGF
jgi:hypothetical protein